MRLDLSSMTSLPLLLAALLVMIGCALLLHVRGSGRVSNSRGRGRGSSRSSSRTSSRGGRRSSGPRINTRVGAAADSRFAAHARFAPNPGGHFAAAPHFGAAQSVTAAQPFVVAPHLAAAQSITAARPFVAAPHFAAAQSITAAQPFVAAPHFAAAQSSTTVQPFTGGTRLAPDQGDLFVSQPDLHVVSQPDLHVVSQPDLRVVSQPDVSQVDLRVVATPPAFSVGPVASISVLAALTEGDKARPAFAPSNSGDAFPTRFRALSLLGGHLFAVLGIFTLSLAATPIGHHMSQVGGISVWELATLCVFAGFAFAAVVAARVQHDIMGGGWDGGFSVPIISYISPEVALYVISPSGISAAARRLNSSPARLILVEYLLLVTAFLVALHRLVGR